MLHDDERFFEVLVMRCKEIEDKENKQRANYFVSRAYGFFGEYGTSWARPLMCLLVLWILFCIILWPAIGIPFENGTLQQTAKILPEGTSTLGIFWFSLKLSLSNSFSFLGFGKLYFGDFLKSLPIYIQTLCMLETILSIPLLFLFGLGVRSRFRVK